jgi:ABC-type nitrate/sulfonate/bicarbonate transport system ATPase subunit
MEFPMAGSNSPKLLVNRVSKKVMTGKTELQILEDISLEINKNDFVCVLGKSGCGKTTLLRIIAGLDPGTSGEVKLDGNVIEGPHFSRCLVFQELNLYPWLTARENISLGLDIRGDKKNKNKRIDQYIRLIGLKEEADRKPKQLSGGEQQRVALARALINKPDVLLLDEPFGKLDPAIRTELQDELLRIWQEERCTVVFVTHDVEEAVYLATRLVVMSKKPGRIQKTLNNPLGHPRVRTEKEFLAFRHYVTNFYKKE